MPDSDARSERLRSLQARFLSRTATEMTSLRAALQAARAGDSPAFATMEDILHRICGTGGSVGFEAMSGYANTMARLVEQGAKGSMTMDAALLGRLDELVDELDYCLQQAALMSGALT